MRSKGEDAMAAVTKAQGAEPRLRFPAFSGAWQSRRVGEIADIYKGKGIAKSDISADGIYQCIRYGELYTVYGEVITDVVSKTSLPSEALFFGEPNDVIIPSSGETKEDIATAACVVPGGIALGGDLNVLRSSENGVFLSYYLNGPLRTKVSRVAQGDTVVHLYPHQIEKLPVSTPSRDEQQKVADCLTSIDARIGAETRELGALKAHKQGLMQQLFPAEGQYQPRLRFPAFTKKWKQTKAGSLFGNRLEAGEEGLPIYAVTMYDGMVLRSSVDRRVDNIAEVNGNRKGHKGDIAYNMMRMWQGACGVAPENCMVSPAYVILAPKAGVCADFFGYLLKLPITLRQLTAHSQGLTLDRLRLYYKDFSAIPMLCPTLGEQQKIASCLSSLDELIARQSRKIFALQQHKKGLMQGLFPAMDAHVA